MFTTKVSRTNTLLLYYYSYLALVYNLFFSKKSPQDPRPRTAALRGQTAVRRVSPMKSRDMCPEFERDNAVLY